MPKSAAWTIRPKKPSTTVPLASAPLGLKFKETFHGYCSGIGQHQDPGDNDRAYRVLEIAARPGFPFELELNVSCEDLSRFFEDYNHQLDLDGSLKYTLPNAAPCVENVTACSSCSCRASSPTACRPSCGAAQERSSGYPYTTFPEAAVAAAAQGKGPLPRSTHVNPARVSEPFERFMYYHLDVPKKGLRLEAYKRVRNDPGNDAWRDTTALFTRVGTPRLDSNGQKLPFGSPLDLLAAGVVHVDPHRGFCTGSCPHSPFAAVKRPSAQARHRDGQRPIPRASTGPSPSLARSSLAPLQRVYSPGAVSLADALFQPISNGVRHEPRLRV